MGGADMGGVDMGGAVSGRRGLTRPLAGTDRAVPRVPDESAARDRPNHEVGLGAVRHRHPNVQRQLAVNVRELATAIASRSTFT